MRIPGSNPNGITSVSFSQQGSNVSVSYNKVSHVEMPQTPAVKYEPGTEAAAFMENYSYTSGDYHRSSVLAVSDERWTTVSNQMHEVEKAVQQERPDIAKKSWDFSVKDGKIVATGTGLTADDKAWLEEKINGTEGLAQAAADFISLASSYLETTKTNPAYTGMNYLTGGGLEYNFHDTKKTLEKAVSFRELSHSLHRAFDTGHGDGDESIGTESGYRAFNYLAATALVPSQDDAVKS